MCNIKEGYIRAQDSKLFYTIKGEGEPLVLIHGNMNDSRIWKYQVESFSKEYKVICFDQRGYGKSDTPTSAFSPYEDLKAVLDALGIEKAIIIGSSSGGSVAIDFALKYPRYVEKMILVAPAINGYRYPLRLMIEAIKNMSLLKSKGFETAIKKFINNPFWAYFIPPESNKEARQLALETMKTKKNFYSWDFKLSIPLKPYAIKRLEEIQLPVLIVLSEKDIAFNKKVGEYIHKSLKNSNKVILADCGHLPFVEKPKEFNDEVLNFIKKQD